MSTLNPTTLIEAVNSLLLIIGEAPVNSLEGSQYTPAAFAENVINETARDVQTLGLHFNTDEGLMMTPDTNGIIEVPNTAVRIDPSAPWKNVTTRNGKLYDKDEKSYIFTDAIECDVVWLFPFEDMPEHVRQYVTIRAGRVFQKRMVGSKQLFQMSEEEEIQARTRMQLVEMDNMDENFIRDGGAMLRFGTQNRGRYW